MSRDERNYVRREFVCALCLRRQLRRSVRDPHGLTVAQVRELGWTHPPAWRVPGWRCPFCSDRPLGGQ
jgi:hypothetical protein